MSATRNLSEHPFNTELRGKPVYDIRLVKSGVIREIFEKAEANYVLVAWEDGKMTLYNHERCPGVSIIYPGLCRHEALHRVDGEYVCDSCGFYLLDITRELNHRTVMGYAFEPPRKPEMCKAGGVEYALCAGQKGHTNPHVFYGLLSIKPDGQRPGEKS